ncbi:hypothetical protein [Rhodoplanes serenus]|uniref:hypothetical protein n=1 Tax=Rhodoplanes serenus TaxID=200615 RepID=UPI000DABF4E6|nr:hypothetical protein [Rhodoplanes serenus]RAI33732.1 hypothetical protein CH340_11325 [Rhodoplanes serenus]
MTVEIIKNIAFPPKVNKQAAAAKYPWNSVEIGDGFKFDGEIRTARGAASAAGKKSGKTKSFRAFMKDGIVYVGRIA